MKIYAYKGTADLGKESLGTEGKLMFELKARWAILRRCKQAFKDNNFRVYSYTNFYNDATFTEIRH